MVSADELRRERDAENSDRERLACQGCGSLLRADNDSCLECGGTNIVTVEEIIDPDFRE